jgi:transposase
LHLATDGHGLPLTVEVLPGQTHEATHVESTLNGVRIAQRLGPPRRRPRHVAGDKAYSSQRVRSWLRAHKMTPVIPHKDNEQARHDPKVAFDKDRYRGRAVVEQCVGWLKENRRLATRFDKLAVHFQAMATLAMIRRYLKTLFSNRA